MKINRKKETIERFNDEKEKKHSSVCRIQLKLDRDRSIK